MSYFEKTQVLAADSPSVDAFGRWRTSTSTTLFDLDDNADVLVLSVRSIGGTNTYHASWDFQIES